MNVARYIVIASLISLCLGACSVHGAAIGQDEGIRRFTPDMPDGAKPLYANMVQHKGTLYLAGMLGFKPNSRELGGDIAEQTELAIDSIASTLQRAEADLSDVLTCTIYLDDILKYGAMNKVYRARFSGAPPARTAVAVADLPLGAEVEIACIAAAP